MEAIAHGNPGKSIALSGYQLFQSDDIDWTRKKVAEVFCPHELKVTGKNQKVDARMHHARIGAISVNRLQYGADVAIDPGQLDDFVLVQMPLAGEAVVTCGNPPHTLLDRQTRVTHHLEFSDPTEMPV